MNICYQVSKTRTAVLCHYEKSMLEIESFVEGLGALLGVV